MPSSSDDMAPHLPLRERYGLAIKGVAVGLSLAISAVAYLIVYRLLARQAGLEAVGYWGLLAAFFQYGRVLDLGASASVLKSVPQLLVAEKGLKVRRHIDSAFFLSGLTGIISALIIAGFTFLYLKDVHLPGGLGVTSFEVILLLNIISLVLMTQGSVIQAAIDAHNRAEIRALLMLIGSVIFGAVAIVLVSRFSILGIAIAQCVQWLFLWIAGRVVLARLSPFVRLLPTLPDVSTIREIIAFGWKFQFAAIIAALFDPTAKAMALRVGGLRFAGQFEILARVVGGGRTIFANGFQVMAPMISSLGADKLNLLMRQSFLLAVKIALLFFVLFVSVTPAAANLIAGGSEEIEYSYSFIFVICWAINILSCPGYFSAIGLSKGNLNLQSHLLMIALLAVLGPLLGYFFAGTGLLTAYGLAVALGGLYLAVTINALFAIKLRALVKQYRPAAFLTIIACSAASVAIGLLLGGWPAIAAGLGVSLVAFLALFQDDILEHAPRIRKLKNSWLKKPS